MGETARDDHGESRTNHDTHYARPPGGLSKEARRTKRAAFSRLLHPERHHRIDARGTLRRNVARRHPDEGDEHDHPG